MNLWILAALVVQVSALVPTCQPPDPHGYCISQGVDNCAPEDRLVTSPTDQCRTSFRFYTRDHILPPEWELMFDSYDYESLVGPVFLSREFDNDGDVSTVADQWEDRGGICQRGLRVCAYTLGPQDNWVFSPHIKYPPGSTTLGGGLPTEIYLNVSFRFTQCNSPCVNNFADLFRYDTNSIASESVRTDRNNYLSTPLFGKGTERTTSRLDQTGRSGTISDTRTLAITSLRTNGFHFGIRDSGNCGQINRIYFYYTPCKERLDGLVNYPELVRAPSGSLPNEGMACCAPNSHPTTSLSFRAHSATDGTTGDEGCERNVRCECNAGYRLNAAGIGCEVCPAGTYDSLDDDQETCLNCPMNTAMDVEGAVICSCLNGFFRYEESPQVDCTRPPGPVRNLRTTTITSTSVSLSWTRPEVTGRDDFYYSIEYSDPGNTGSLILSNGNYVNSALTVSYTVPNLRPNTPYTTRVTTHNGVSDQDTENEDLRRVDLPLIRTREGVPSVPRDVQVFSGVVVWGPPAEPNGVITGYQLRFSGFFTRTTVSKLPSESYHVVTDDNIRNLGSNIQVSVRARTSAGPGPYSSLIQYTGNSCPPPITCPPEISCPMCPPTLPPPTCPMCPPILPPPTCPMCPPILPPPTCPPTEPSTPCPLTTCPPPPTTCPPEQGDVYFILRGQNYTNGDTVMITDIGEGDNALLCVTENTECCRQPDDGEFFYPDGTAIGFSSITSLYRNSGEQLIRLNRRNGATSPLGRYRCAIPDASGVTRSVYVNIVAGEAPPPPVTCPVLPNPANGGVRVLSLSIAIGSLASYTCNPGYTLSGSSRRTCLPNGQWSGNAPTCQQDAIGFMLRGETFANGSSISLEDIGETDEALIFRTEIKDCCKVQKIGQCYDPNGVQLSIRVFNNELYRNRDSQLVRLNKNKIFTGQAAIPGLYCCTVPNNDGNLHRICANIIA